MISGRRLHPAPCGPTASLDKSPTLPELNAPAKAQLPCVRPAAIPPELPASQDHLRFSSMKAFMKSCSFSTPSMGIPL